MDGLDNEIMEVYQGYLCREEHYAFPFMDTYRTLYLIVFV